MLRREGNRQAFMERFQGPAEPDRTGELPRLRARTLVLWGGKDRWIPVEMARRFHGAIPGAELAVLPDLGHVPMEEAPEVTARLVERFLTSGR